MSKAKARIVVRESIRYVDFPWSSVSGYFNGDMFEDWLSKDSDNDPHHKLKQFFRLRDEQIIKATKKKVLSQVLAATKESPDD